MENEIIYGLAGLGTGIGVSYAYYRNKVRSLLGSMDKILQDANNLDFTDKRKTLLFRDRLRTLGGIMDNEGISAGGTRSYASLIENELMEENNGKNT